MEQSGADRRSLLKLGAAALTGATEEDRIRAHTIFKEV
jgi:hypothetical protein